jgi:hypothetical protein
MQNSKCKMKPHRSAEAIVNRFMRRERQCGGEIRTIATDKDGYRRLIFFVLWHSKARAGQGARGVGRAAGISGFWGADDYNGEQMAAPVAQMDRAAVS